MALFVAFLCISAGARPTLALCGSYSGTLPAAGSPYVVTCDIDVPSGDTLVIEPAADLRFQSGTKLVVHGTLTAEGTLAQPIRFTSASSAPAGGDWDGIRVYGTADIRHTTVEFAATGVLFFPGSGGAITDTDFVEAFTAMRLGGDVWAPLRRLRAWGGGWNGIRISSDYTTSGTLTEPGIPYLVLDPVSFSGAMVTIEPGVIFKSSVLSGNFLEFDGDLIAEGTEEQPIVFTAFSDDTVGGDTNGDGDATSPVVGEWSGLELGASGVNDYRLRHLDVRWGWYGIRFNGACHGYLTDSSFTDISHCPVILNDVKWQPALKGLNAERCQGGNGVQIVSHGSYGETTWAAGIGIPYIFKGANEVGMVSGVSAYLTIEPGAIFKFDSGASLTVRADLTAHGTLGNPIIFTSIKDDSVGGDTNGDGDATSPGTDDWDRLELGFTASSVDKQELQHAEIRYATWGITAEANLPVALTDVKISWTETGFRCNTSGLYWIDMQRIGLSRNLVGIDLQTGCTVTIKDGWVSQSETGLDCDGEVTVDGLDINQASIGIRVRAGCDAVVTRSDFVGNSTGVGAFSATAGIDLGNLSDLDSTNDGGNSFVCNNMDVQNMSGTAVTAENNWWGEAPPDQSTIVGPVDVEPHIVDGSNALIPDLEVLLYDDGSSELAVQLSWHDRSSACGYRVWRSLAPDSGFTDVSGHVATGPYYDLGAGSTLDDYFYFIEID